MVQLRMNAGKAIARLTPRVHMQLPAVMATVVEGKRLCHGLNAPARDRSSWRLEQDRKHWWVTTCASDLVGVLKSEKWSEIKIAMSIYPPQYLRLTGYGGKVPLI